MRNKFERLSAALASDTAFHVVLFVGVLAVVFLMGAAYEAHCLAPQ